MDKTFLVKKEYKLEKQKVRQLINRNGQQKEIDRDVEIKVQSNNRKQAFDEARKEAKKQGCADVSLLREDDDGFEFQIYNPIKVEKPKKVTDEK